jgi:protein phosphatase
LDKIAVISDIHGNIPALETVLGDIRGRGIDLIYNLGDLVGKGANSDVAVDMCREACQVIVRGNWDDNLPQGTYESADWYRVQVGAERLAYLSNLPVVYDFRLSGKRVRLFHASQTSLYNRVHMYQPYETHLAMFENTPFTGLDTLPPDIVGYGDIHAAYMLSLSRHNKTLFNAGSVGNPLDMPMATYVILSGMLDSTKPAPFSIEIIRLPYDIERAIEDGRKIDLPELDYYAVELRTAVYRGRQKAG